MHLPQDRDAQQPSGDNRGDICSAMHMKNGIFSYANYPSDGKYAYKSNI